jgi:hypothetical protein
MIHFFEKKETSKKKRMSSSSSSSSSSIGIGGSGSGSSQPLSLNSLPTEVLANVGLFLTEAERANARLIGRYQSSVFSRQPLKLFRVTVRKSRTTMKFLKNSSRREFALFTDSTGNVKPEEVSKLFDPSFNIIRSTYPTHMEQRNLVVSRENFPELVFLQNPIEYYLFYDNLFSNLIYGGILLPYYQGRSLLGDFNDITRLLQTSGSGKTYVRKLTVNLLYEVMGFNNPELIETLSVLDNLLLTTNNGLCVGKEILKKKLHSSDEISDMYVTMLREIIRGVQNMSGTAAQKVERFSSLFVLELSEELFCEKFTLTPDAP